MKEVNPQGTSQGLAFELWMKAPMPKVPRMKTLDVTALVRLSRKRGYKFNMLLCWCIGKAAGMEDLYLLPVGEKLMRCDRLAVNIDERFTAYYDKKAPGFLPGTSANLRPFLCQENRMQRPIFAVLSASPPDTAFAAALDSREPRGASTSVSH